MKPVDQTKFVGAVPPENPEDAGNCFQACIASLLELSLEEVPHFVAMDDWWGEFITWVDERGFHLIETDRPLPGVFGLMSGPSPRGDFKHVVICRGQEVAHDPHPSRAGLGGEERTYWYLVPVDPARMYGGEDAALKVRAATLLREVAWLEEALANNQKPDGHAERLTPEQASGWQLCVGWVRFHGEYPEVGMIPYEEKS